MDGTVLLADDDRAIRTVITQALTRAGVKVHATSSLTMLMRWVEEGRGDVVITDVMMPDGNGIELVPAIHARRPDMPVIVISARNTVMTALEAAEVEAWEYLPKPFDLSALLQTVGRALEASEAARRRPGKVPAAQANAASASAPGQAPASGPAPDAAAAAGQGVAGRYGDPQVAPRHAEAAMEIPSASPVAELRSELPPVNGRIEEDPIPLVGTAPAMQAVFRTMSRLMGGSEPVLVLGESGTGKTRVAHVLHDFGPRGSRPLVVVDAESLSRPDAIETLLGKANGGSILVEEVSTFDMSEQRRLLALIERAEAAGVRILATSLTSLQGLSAPAEQGGLRPDLFYRLSGAAIALPPLRERLSDVPALAEDFLQRNRARLHPVNGIAPEALVLLQRHPWPGNVRQLENVLRRAALGAVGMRIEAEAVREALAQEPEGAGGGRRVLSRTLEEAVREHLRDLFNRHRPELPPPGLHAQVLEEVERPLVEITLEATGCNQLKAAALLGINRNTLRRKISDLGIKLH